MKILHLGYSDQIGGAAKASYRLHKGLCTLGVESYMFVGHKCTDDENVFGPSALEKAWLNITPFLDRLPGKFYFSPQKSFLSTAWTGSNFLRYVDEVNPDIVQLHWVGAGFLRLESLPSINKPVVWRLPDMWAFSGAEHYLGGSPRYKEGYSKTNIPKSDHGFDVNRWVWQRKMKTWPQIKDLTIVCPSRWLAQCARQSILFKDRPIEVIPTGQDISFFNPKDKNEARKKLGLSLDKKIILFGAADSTTDPRKGYNYLKGALQKLSRQDGASNIEVVLFGNQNQEIRDLGLKVHNLGWFDRPENLATVYSASDVFAAPSIEENLANTVIEAMACGIPVVAFEIGGMPDIIDHQSNGYLSKNVGEEGLCQGLNWVLEDSSRWKSLSENARNKVTREFSLELQAKKYSNLYENILEKTRDASKRF